MSEYGENRLNKASMLTLLTRDTSAEDLARLLSDHVPLELIGARDALVRGIATYSAMAEGSITYQALSSAPAGNSPVRRTVICTPDNQRDVAATTKIIVDDSRAAFMILLSRVLRTVGVDFERTIAAQAGGIEPGKYEAHPTAVVEGPVIIGRGAVLSPHVVIRKGTVIGDGTIVAAGTVIGEDGRAIHKCADGRLLSWAGIHVGTVRIGSRCEVGANATILRGVLGQTLIGDGTIIGNGVNVGHGTIVGARCWIGVGCVVCGHATIGDGASVGAGTVVRDNIEIGANASVGMGSVVVKSVAPGASVMGHPATPVDHNLRSGPVR